MMQNGELQLVSQRNDIVRDLVTAHALLDKFCLNKKSECHLMELQGKTFQYRAAAMRQVQDKTLVQGPGGVRVKIHIRHTCNSRKIFWRVRMFPLHHFSLERWNGNRMPNFHEEPGRHAFKKRARRVHIYHIYP